ncbi:MAG: NADH-quinone oxidoreductase subunit L [Anaerosomatales bacterium]|nr:NADH-quinone oxidoreductase subunit L [Anaerosomatales bacterium]
MGALLASIGLPLAIAAVIVAGGTRAVRVTRVFALAGPFAALAAGASLIASVHGDGAVPLWNGAWLAQGDAAVPVGFTGDALAALMLVIVGVVAACVVAFSWGYMAHEDGQPRYYAVLMLFVSAMSVLVLADNLVTLFVGWELVGACSYLLIGFWYRKPAATRAAIKAFMTTRVGDVAMLVGMAVLWRHAGTLSVREIVAALPRMEPGVITAAALLLFGGAAGKSAQFPLHIWLPDAMEGPTPVSALIHAATMVASGVFLVARTWPVFEASALARTVMLAIGVVTALYAAVVALAQTDIKKMLAYSTISQLGFMFAALGASAWGAAMFHLTTHAAFKALLFLAAGSVIHGAGTQDLREMGGLAKAMPVTAACWTAGTLALSGWWPLSGFFSKDAIVAAVGHVSPVASAALILTSALTALYVWRATALAFLGSRRSDQHAHESGIAMTAPLALLAVLAVVLGWFGRPLFELLSAEEAHPAAATIALAVVAVAAGTGAAFAWWTRERGAPDAGVGGAAWDRVRAGFGVDAALQAVTVRRVVAVARWLDDVADERIIDRIAEGSGRLAVAAGGALAKLQSGEADVYASFVAVGFVVLAAIVLWAGGR